MKPLTREWWSKAEQDCRTASVLMKVDLPPFDHVCFHAQQATEKYLKAILQERDFRFPRIHDLVDLVHRIDPPEPSLLAILVELRNLTDSAVDVRYPGFAADRLQAENSLQTARRVRMICADLLDEPCD